MLLCVILSSVILLNLILLSVILLNFILLNVILIVCHSAKCHFPECRDKQQVNITSIFIILLSSSSFQKLHQNKNETIKNFKSDFD